MPSVSFWDWEFRPAVLGLDADGENAVFVVNDPSVGWWRAGPSGFDSLLNNGEELSPEAFSERFPEAPPLPEELE